MRWIQSSSTAGIRKEKGGEGEESGKEEGRGDKVGSERCVRIFHGYIICSLDTDIHLQNQKPHVFMFQYKLLKRNTLLHVGV